MSLLFSHVFTPPTSLTTSKFPTLSTQLHLKRRTRITATPARDRIISFGRHKGKMLGTLPSNYLKWVSKNLITQDVQEWGQLASEVLQDPVYKDRIEWEYAENLLTGDRVGGRVENPVEELMEVSERFGWDNDDKIGWGRIDFSLLGTSKGGRIPRKGERCVSMEGGGSKKKVIRVSGKREERIERQRMRRAEGTPSLEGRTDLEDEKQMGKKNANPFPGREALLKKVFDSRRPL